MECYLIEMVTSLQRARAPTRRRKSLTTSMQRFAFYGCSVV